MKFQNSKFLKQKVELDGNQYDSCQFEDSELVYKGLASVSLIKCEFRNVKWSLDGAAGLTMNFLRALYHGAGQGGRDLVEKTFQQIRTP